MLHTIFLVFESQDAYKKHAESNYLSIFRDFKREFEKTHNLPTTVYGNKGDDGGLLKFVEFEDTAAGEDGNGDGGSESC